MELSKQSLFNIQLFTDPISNNFKLIEQEFKNLYTTLSTIKQENKQFKSFVNKVQDIMQKKLVDNKLSRQSFSNQSVIQINMDDESDVLKDIEKYESKLNEHHVQNQISNSMRRINVGQTTSYTLLNELQNEDNSEIINQGQLNVPSQNNRQNSNRPNPSRAQQKKNNPLNPKTQQIHKNNQKQAKKLSVKYESGLLQKEIQKIKEQIALLNNESNGFKQHIQLIQKENQQFRKCLGLKKKVIMKDKTNTQINQNQSKSKKNIRTSSKKSITSQINLQSSKKYLPNQRQNNQNDQQQIQIPGFRQLYGQVQKIRDYLSGKVRAIDVNFLQINTKIHSVLRDMQILQRTDNSLKQDIQSLEKTCNQTKLNLTQINQKSMMQGTKSRYRKNCNNTDKSILDNQKNINETEQIQERIVDLLEEMEKLKQQYQQIMFGKKQNQGNQDELSPEVLEKRKKLALKLNGNAIVDEKLKKELASCKRDLKKLQESFDYLMNGVNTGSHEIKTLIIKPNQTKQEWKSLSTKIYKVKQQLQTQIKQLQGKITANNQLAVVLNQFEVGIQECKIILKKKLDITDFQKTTKRIEGRLNNFIKQTFQKQGYTNQQDAIMAKQPWFCLSCDVQLKSYSGKVARNINILSNSGQKFVGKKVNPQSHMVRRNQNGRLPSIAI